MNTTIILRIAFSVACVMFCFGCGANNGTVETASQEPPAGSEPGGLSKGEVGNSEESNVNPTNSETIESFYTDLSASKCKTTESNEEEGWIVQECPGVGGFKLEVSEGDLRQTINVISPSGKRSELEFWSNVSSGFSTIGEKAEWRVLKTGNKVAPFALITRYNVSENPEKPEKTTSYLVVTKITPDSSCIVEIIKPIPNANDKARVSADSASNKPCLKSK